MIPFMNTRGRIHESIVEVLAFVQSIGLNCFQFHFTSHSESNDFNSDKMRRTLLPFHGYFGSSASHVSPTQPFILRRDSNHDLIASSQ